MDETKPSAPLTYPNISSLSEQCINDKIIADNKFNKNINIIKDMRNNSNINWCRYTLFPPTVFATNTINSSLSKRVNFKKRNKIMKFFFKWVLYLNNSVMNLISFILK